jgi:hypothetical protein
MNIQNMGHFLVRFLVPGEWTGRAQNRSWWGVHPRNSPVSAPRERMTYLTNTFTDVAYFLQWLRDDAQ